LLPTGARREKNPERRTHGPAPGVPGATVDGIEVLIEALITTGQALLHHPAQRVTFRHTHLQNTKAGLRNQETKKNHLSQSKPVHPTPVQQKTNLTRIAATVVAADEPSVAAALAVAVPPSSP